MDFAEINNRLLASAEQVLHEWLPAGKRRGREWVVGNLRGDPGESLSINMDTGVWADFAGAERGGDLVSLYAAMRGVSQSEACRALTNGAAPGALLVVAKKPTAKVAVMPVPNEAPEPTCRHYQLGAPSATWRYLDRAGKLLLVVARYDPPGKGKEFRPWCWTGERWESFMPTGKRPLYGQQNIAHRRAVLLCEGEKAADAAQEIIGHRGACVSWMGGASAWSTADWSPLYGRDVLIWPDADAPGLDAAERITQVLSGHGCRVTVLDVQDMPAGWDAADFEGGWDEYHAWSTPRLRKVGAMIPVLPSARATVIGVDEWRGASVPARQEYLRIEMTDKRVPHPNIPNAARVIEGSPDYAGNVWYDEFHDAIMIRGADDERARAWTDADDVRLTAHIQGDVGITNIKKSVVRDAVVLAAHKAMRNECKDYMESLEWDGTDRLEHLMSDAFGAEQTDYTADVGRNWFVSMAARVYQPGCQVDTMVILEGSQGIRKSTALSVIAKPWFVEVHESVLTKDFFEVLRGNLLAEIAEMHSFSRGEVERIKGVISCRHDKYRKAYGHSAETHPRICVLAGTTNRDDYHRDETGGRRFWPVRCGEINIEYLSANRDQLWAEAVARYKRCEPWWEISSAEQTRQIESRQEYDPWQELVATYLAGQITVWHTAAEVMAQALDIDAAHQDRNSTARVNRIFRLMRWELGQKVLPDGSRVRAWRRPK